MKDDESSYAWSKRISNQAYRWKAYEKDYYPDSWMILPWGDDQVTETHFTNIRHFNERTGQEDLELPRRPELARNVRSTDRADVWED